MAKKATIMTSLFRATLMLLTCVVWSESVQAQPPGQPDDYFAVKLKAVEDPLPNQNGPSVGISVRNNQFVVINGQNVSGVQVLRDNKRKALYSDDSQGRWKRYRFNTPHDIITEVNGTEVSSSQDVLQNTNNGWNTLRVFDTSNQSYRYYAVKLP